MTKARFPFVVLRDTTAFGDTTHGQAMSRHRTAAAAVRAMRATNRAVRRHAGPSAYLPMDLVRVPSDCDRGAWTEGAPLTEDEWIDANDVVDA